MLSSLDLGRNSKSEFTVCEIGKKWQFLGENDVFLTKKRAKNAVFCYWSVNVNTIYIIDSMCVIRDLIGKKTLPQPRGGVGVHDFPPNSPNDQSQSAFRIAG
jgi:hypothetical protein